MKYEIYGNLIVDKELRVFEFVSAGKLGSIIKRIAFVPTAFENVYNLAFGDVNDRGQLDDYAVSDNGDRNKILATIAKVVELYTDKYPERWIYFRGSTNCRTRLYRMAVGLNLDELSRQFEIYAEVDNNDEFIPFQKNMNISAFLIKRKFL
jgi:hypothetical protein